MESSGVAEALNGKEMDVDYLTNMVFAEDAGGGEAAWRGLVSAVRTTLGHGLEGKSVREVIDNISSAVKGNSPQWQLANSGRPLSPTNKRVMDKIREIARWGVSDEWEDTIDGATKWEGVGIIKDKGHPSWSKSMNKVRKEGNTLFYKADTSRDDVSFGEAFGDAKRKGEKQFSWRGRPFAVK